MNQLINFCWTILGFIPLFLFWMTEGINAYFYVYVTASLIMALLPAKAIDRLLLSRNTKFYEKLGVKFIRKFVQDGDWVRKTSNPQKPLKVHTITQAKLYLKTIAMYERFHWLCFAFFLLSAILCFARHNWLLAASIMVANTLYNVTTLLLQQYNKLRIRKITQSSAF